MTPAPRTMNWCLVSLFRAGDGWIPSFLGASAHRFTIIDPTYSHDRSRSNASLSDWRDYLLQALKAWVPFGTWRTDGIITVFPQLALITGLVKRLTLSRRPVVAWMFNLGKTYHGWHGVLARFGYAAVDCFVVHSTHEIDVYSEWLRLPRERFVFVPLSVAEKPIEVAEDAESPFILSMGSANRDYPLLLQVLARLPHRALIVAGSHALQGLAVPPNVTVRAGLTEDDCRLLCQRARVSVIPLRNLETAAGQVTVVEAMMSGRPLVTTRSVGTVDYVEDGVDGLLVAPADPAAMQAAIERLWDDASDRARISDAARRSALAKFTFRAVASDLERILDGLSGGVRPDRARTRDSVPTR